MGHSEGQNDENLPEVGVDGIQLNREESIMTLREWESGILITNQHDCYYGRSLTSPMNITTTRVPE